MVASPVAQAENPGRRSCEDQERTENQACFERYVAERPGKMWVFWKQALSDRERLGENRKVDGLKAD